MFQLFSSYIHSWYIASITLYLYFLSWSQHIWLSYNVKLSKMSDILIDFNVNNNVIQVMLSSIHYPMLFTIHSYSEDNVPFTLESMCHSSSAG